MMKLNSQPIHHLFSYSCMSMHVFKQWFNHWISNKGHTAEEAYLFLISSSSGSFFFFFFGSFLLIFIYFFFCFPKLNSLPVLCVNGVEQANVNVIKDYFVHCLCCAVMCSVLSFNFFKSNTNDAKSYYHHYTHTHTHVNTFNDKARQGIIDSNIHIYTLIRTYTVRYSDD